MTTENQIKLTGGLINEHEAAVLLGIKVSTLRAWRVKGSTLPFCRIGRAIRYARDDIDDFIAASKATSTTEAANA